MTSFAGFEESRIDVGGGPIDGGHHMAEDAPDEPAAELGRSLAM